MNEPATLADLVNIAKQRLGTTSTRALSREAHKRELVLSYTTANQMANGSYTKRPSPETCEALAALSGVSRETVYRIANVRMRERVDWDAIMPPETDLLDPLQRQAIVEVARGFVRDKKKILELEQQHAQRDTPASANQPDSAGVRERLAHDPEPEQKTAPVRSFRAAPKEKRAPAAADHPTRAGHHLPGLEGLAYAADDGDPDAGVEPEGA